VGARSGGRFLFLVPWEGRALVGTSYEPATAAPSDPLLFLEQARLVFPWAGLAPGDLALVHEGLVPGSGHADGLATRGRVIDHGREGGPAGLVSIVGVKYTTARALAERAIDRVLAALGRAPVACRTATTPLAHARPLDGTLEERALRAAREEMAVTLADAVLRRLDVGSAGPPGPAETAAVSRVLARELGWDAARERAEQAALAAFYASRGGTNPLLE
jgi:glycerol-3-phosphate dehydrogenase